MLPPNQVTYDNFKTFVTNTRFQGSEKQKAFEKKVDEFKASKPSTSVTIIRGEQRPSTHSGISEDANENSPFQRVGKSDFLHNARDMLQKKDFEVFDFLNARDELIEGGNFYVDIFLQKLIEAEPKLRPVSSRLAMKTHFFSMLFTRSSLLTTVALPSLSAVIVFSLGLLGFDFIKFAADTKNQNFILNILSWLQQHSIAIYLLVAVSFIAWVLYAWGKVRSNGELYEKWGEAGERKDPLEIEQALKEHLKENPQKILSQLCKRKHNLAFIIDDIDLFKTPSFQLLEKFYVQAEKTPRCFCFFVLAYNHQNPILHQNNRTYIRDSLDVVELRKKNWFLIKLEPPTWEDVISLMLQYYRNDKLVALIEDLKRYLPELKDNPGFFLTFFTNLNLHPDEMEHLTVEQTLEDLEKFLGRNRDMAQQFLTNIKEYDPDSSSGSFELLKFILAFKQRAVRIRALKTVTEKQKLTDFNKYLQILVSAEPRLLEKDTRDNEAYIKFREPYYRSIITSGWAEWQDQCDDYYSIVLHSITKDKIYRKENPEIALDASPSKLAIELLYRYGEYHYKYKGSSYSDAGYVLRFVGCEEDNRGALAKWFTLFQQAVANGDDLAPLIEWRSGVRFNPYAGQTGQSYERPFFAPALILLTGQLYRIIGQWKRAYTIWTKDWEQILDKLDAEEIPNKLHKKIIETDIEIRKNLAEMLFAVGHSENNSSNPHIGFWEETGDLISSFREQFPATAEMLRTLLRHYRKVGVGNLLHPYHFLTDKSDLVNLERSLDKLEDHHSLERIRLLFLMADEYWQIIRYQIEQAENAPNLLDLKVEKISRLDLELESLVDLFKRHIQLSYESLRSFTGIAENQIKKQRGRPNDRILRGDILYWEAMHLFMMARLFQIETIRVAGQFSGTFKRKRGTRNRKRRVENAITIINTMGRLCSPKFTGQSIPSNFEDVYSEFEKIEIQAQSANDNKLISLDVRLTTTLLPKIYKAGLSGLTDMAEKQLLLAEAVYHQLGYRSRVASVKFAKGLLFFEFKRDSSCFNEFDFALDWCSGELGYHLDVLRNHLIFAQAAESTALHRAVNRYFATQRYLQSQDLRLPQALSSEVTFHVARIMGNMENAPYPEDLIISYLNSARSYYLQIDKDKIKFVNADTVDDRLLNCYWWLAEMYHRLANRESDNVVKIKYLNQAMSEANYIFKRVKSTPEGIYQENMTRITFASVLYDLEQYAKSFTESEIAIEYFLGQKDYSNALQGLKFFVPRLFDAPAHNVFGDDRDKKIQKYLAIFLRTTDIQINDLENLGALSRIILYRAILVLQNIFDYISVDLQAIKEMRSYYSKFKTFDEIRLDWYGIVFDILESLSLYASAIRLYESVSVIYRRNSPKFDADFEKYKLRIIEAARKFEPAVENASYADFGWIIRDCAAVVFDPSELEGTKQEMLNLARKAIRDAGEINEGITLLKKAKALIDISIPEGVDIRILNRLKLALYQNGETQEAKRIEEELRTLQSVVQSRDFLSVAEYLEKQNRAFIWALEIAAKTKTNRFSRRAKARLRELKVSEDIAQEDAINVENVQEFVLVLNDLLELPVHELTDADLRYLLYDVLEPELRKLIMKELSNKTSNWWRERVPKGPRSAAEEKQKRAEGIKRTAGFGNIEEHPIEYLDFPHYFEIIRFNVNWVDTFQSIFGDKEKIRLQFQDVVHGRNTMSHSRSLKGDERNAFVVSARRILRQIYSYKKSEPVNQDSLLEAQEAAENLAEKPKQNLKKVNEAPQVNYNQSDVTDLAFSIFITVEHLQNFIEQNSRFKQIWPDEMASAEERKEIVERFIQVCYENNLSEELISTIKTQSSQKYGKWYAALIRKSKETV